MIDEKRMGDYCAAYGIKITPEQLGRLDTYAKLLVEWNEKVNLTSIVEPNEIEVKHFLDSLLLLTATEIPKGARMIDVGCGAGFPSLPCKILRKDLKLTLLDSLNKRINFLKKVAEEVDVTEVEFVHERAEVLGRSKEHREKYQIATARAVANLRELSEYCLPFVKVGGVFLALKGHNVEDELEQSRVAIAKLGGEIEQVLKMDLPLGNARSIIIIRKVSQTSLIFPRTPLKIAKSPI